MMDWIWLGSFSIHLILNILGVLANSLLIYLVLKRTPQQIAVYSTLILNVALCDLVACFAAVFVHPRISGVGLDLYIFYHGPCKFIGPSICHIGYATMFHCIAHSLTSLLLSFAYRYYVLMFANPKRRTIIAILILVYLPSFVALVLFCFDGDSVADVKLAVEKNIGYNTSSECMGGHLNILKWKTLVPILYMTLPVTPTYIAILILRKLIITALSCANMSKRTRVLHSQLLRALVIQACLPIFFVVAVIFYGIGQFNIYHHPFFEYNTATIYGLLPVLGPFTSLYTISPYRLWIDRKISRPHTIATIHQETTVDGPTLQRG